VRRGSPWDFHDFVVYYARGAYRDLNYPGSNWYNNYVGFRCGSVSPGP